MWKSQTNHSVLFTSLFLLLLTTAQLASSSSSSSSDNGCKEGEREALLKFKKSLTKSSKLLSSWKEVEEDCCKWGGVSCDNSTGHVIKLDLSPSSGDSGGKQGQLKANYLDDSLLELEHLEELDLSHNDFGGTPIPRFIGSMKKLTYLYLGGAGFSGSVPIELGNLHSLVFLDLTSNALTGIEGGLWGILRNLCSLKSLYFSDTQIHGLLLSRPYGDSSKSGCAHFELEHLELSDNTFMSGMIPDWLGKELRRLNYLSLKNNGLVGQIPESLGFLSALEQLDLSKNNLSGKVPFALGKLSSLVRLDISSNSFEGSVLSEAHLGNLSNLQSLFVSDTFLTVDLPSDWVPPFQLVLLDMSFCKINGPLPHWLKTQTQLDAWHFSNANITGTIPKWVQNMSTLYSMYLSNNFLSGPLLIDDDEHTNLGNLQTIDLSNNFISGSIPEDIAHKLPSLVNLILSNNQVNGSIPESLCQIASLGVLDLQNNQLSGSIPDCWNDRSVLELINLSFNKLSGTIPCSLGQLPFLGYLHLNKNNLSGEIPSCLSVYTSLKILDLGENKLSGKIPTSFNGERFSYLLIFRLRGNQLNGVIPKELCSLPSLIVMDIAHNNLSGTIPRCLNNLTGMAFPKNISYVYERSYLDDVNSVRAVIQGVEHSYTSTLLYLVNIDLSSNNFMGSIPDEITSLSGLLGLNLSNNRLTGKIPNDIGDLKSLVSLDLSGNKLWGTIPGSMGSLYSLAHLNLSYNNFSGIIPTGNQLQTLNDPSMYAGNLNLCGDPLPKKCVRRTDEEQKKGSGDEEGDQDDEDEEDRHEKMWFYLVVMSGFATGFWGVIGTLLLKRRWRQAFLRSIEDAYEWVCVAIVLRIAKLKTK